MSKRKYYDVYRYDELSSKAQESAIQQLRDIEDLPFLEDDMNCFLSEALEKNKIAGEGKVLYSLNYCQGDGVMFEGSFSWKEHDIIIKQRGGGYYHFNAHNVEMGHSDSGDEATDDIREEFEEIYESICKELQRAGYAHIEANTSDEHYLSEIEERQCWFTKDGVLDECDN